MTSTARDIVGELKEAVEAVQARTTLTPALGIVAGSGLGALAGLVEEATRIPYGEIPHMLAPTVVGHTGELVIGRLEGLPVAVLSGRIHAYEGHDLADVVFGVRLVARLGARRVLLTNAAGGIHRWLEPGTLCRVVDHINFTGQSCLTGPNIEALGPRFPDMSRAYCPELGDLIAEAAASAGVPLAAGVYACLNGPAYETPAEIRMLRVLGASLAGMSTVHECTALNHMGVTVGAISVVTNHAAGVSPELLDHADVKEVAATAGPNLLALLRRLAQLLRAADAREDASAKGA